MGRSNEEKLWYIKIESGKGFLHKGGKRIQQFSNVIGAKKSSATVRGRGGKEVTRDVVELEFAHNATKPTRSVMLYPEFFNQFDCDGDLRKIACRSAEGLARELCGKIQALKELPSVDEATESSTTQTAPNHNTTPPVQKRQTPPLFATSDAKRSKKDDKDGCILDLRQRCDEHLIDNLVHFIPIEKLVLPPKQRQSREVNKTFLDDLQKQLRAKPSGSYQILSVLVKDVQEKQLFDKERMRAGYEYEVLGGTHLMLATQKMHAEDPTNVHFSGRVAKVYVGLSDEEARFVGADHNNTGGFRHDLTFKDELEICRTELFGTANQDLSQDPPEPSEKWREVCAELLNKKRANLSEHFTISRMSGNEWIELQKLHQMWEAGEVKDQGKVKAGDVIKYGKPVLRQSHLKEICNLTNDDSLYLLKKVTNKEMSLTEFAKAAREAKRLRPIQEAIMEYFKVDWDELSNKLGKSVSPKNLLNFVGCDLEKSHSFQKFLGHIKHVMDPEEGNIGPEIIKSNSGGNGIIITGMDTIHQNVADLPRFQGVSFTIAKETDERTAKDIIKMVAKVNFTKLTSFSISLITKIDDVKHLKEVMTAEGATSSKSGHFYIKSKASLITYVLGHWSVARQEGPSIAEVEEVADHDNGIATLARKCCCKSDSVLLFIPSAIAMATILQEGRNCIMVSIESEKELLRSRVLADLENLEDNVEDNVDEERGSTN
ncbi:predicted protein [Nematostella vectensis]|uniref:Uncharacterized protein n=1 Tax=Nematostella vectensis TaxID=45351 RepID=A7RT40_NEMVE|nr:predicted protein [Nematostella vectensis]|eukprot:XP_001637387.1 predicted protein [Nematostella vectensis]